MRHESIPSENRRKTGGRFKPGNSVGQQFRPGQSGNPGGRPKSRPITEIYESILSDPKNCAEIEAAIMKIIRRGGMACVLLLREMAERTEGKVVQSVGMEVSGKVTLEQVLEAEEKIGRSDSEARLRVVRETGT